MSDENGQNAGPAIEPQERELFIEKAAYRAFSPKAFLHMAIGLVVVLVIIVVLTRDLLEHFGVYWNLGQASLDAMNELQELILTTVAAGLAVAAAIELAYTLYTFEPDEALNPVMLGLAGAIILQLAKLDNFEWNKCVGLVLCVLALGGLFAIRKWIAEFYPEPPPTKARETPLQRLRRQKAAKEHRKAQERTLRAVLASQPWANVVNPDRSPSGASAPQPQDDHTS